MRWNKLNTVGDILNVFNIFNDNEFLIFCSLPLMNDGKYIWQNARKKIERIL